MGELTSDMSTLRERRQKAAAASTVELKQLSLALEKAKSDAVKESDLEMKKMQSQVESRRQVLVNEAERLQKSLDMAQQKCRRGK